MGLTFKENCADIRNSCIQIVITQLKKLNCQIVLYDPWSNSDEIKYMNLRLKVPLEREKYLEILYGKNWKVESDFWLKK